MKTKIEDETEFTYYTEKELNDFMSDNNEIHICLSTNGIFINGKLSVKNAGIFRSVGNPELWIKEGFICIFNVYHFETNLSANSL